MKTEKFYDILLKGSALGSVREDWSAGRMRQVAEYMGLSNRVAKRYIRIAARFYSWDELPAKSVRALDELASCALVTDTDIYKRTKRLGKLMNTRQARKLVVDCIVRDEPILELVLPCGDRVATHKEVAHCRKMLKERPTDFARQAFVNSVNRADTPFYWHVGDDKVLLTGTTTKIQGGLW